MKKRRGFTLIELLVVIVILSVIAATAVLSIGALGTDEEIDRESRRLAALPSRQRPRRQPAES